MLLNWQKGRHIMKNILILNGSPRAHGNTAALVDAFSRGAQEAGNTVHICNLRTMNIHPCIGCLQGGKTYDSPCVQKDDMDQIYTLYRSADCIVYASPLYWWSFSAQLKAAIDRLFAVMEGSSDNGAPAYQTNLTAKECIMLVPAEEEHTANFELANHYFDGRLQRVGWKDGGRLLAGGLMQAKDIQNRPEYLSKAYELGRSIR